MFHRRVDLICYLSADTLASGFNLTDEKVKVTVPAVVSRTSYIVVLFGDSGALCSFLSLVRLSISFFL
jgi:hypothetical protein